MPEDLVRQITNMLEELQIVTDEHDLNVIYQNLYEDDFGYDYERR